MRVSTSTGAALHIYFTPFPPTLHPKHTHVSLTTLHPSPLAGYLRWPERAIDRESEEHVRSQRRLKECLGADPRGEALLFRKGVVGCCGFNRVEEASIAINSVPPGIVTVGVFDAASQRLTFEDGAVWKLLPCTAPFQTPAQKQSCEQGR